jgi:hypothetical protein
VLAPRPLAMPDPDYTEQAREAKLQGMCVLKLIVGADGKPRDIHVIRSWGWVWTKRRWHRREPMDIRAGNQRWHGGAGSDQRAGIFQTELSRWPE